MAAAASASASAAAAAQISSFVNRYSSARETLASSAAKIASPAARFPRKLGTAFAAGSPLLIREPFHRRNCEHKSRSIGIRCEKSSKQRNAAAVWLGRLAMVGFASAITVEIATGKGLLEIINPVEVTLANDGQVPVWFMCQMTHKGDSLYALAPNNTYRFNFTHVAFPMRWCYLYIHPGSHGFFWAYSVRSRCTKCFWSIDKHPSLYRNDIGRWERQKLFMPPAFNIAHFFKKDNSTTL